MTYEESKARMDNYRESKRRLLADGFQLARTEYGVDTREQFISGQDTHDQTQHWINPQTGAHALVRTSRGYVVEYLSNFNPG